MDDAEEATPDALPLGRGENSRGPDAGGFAGGGLRPLQLAALMVTASSLPAHFRALERVRLRRLAARVEPILWVEMLAIAGLAAAFLFWQIHLQLASLAVAHGADAATRRLGLLLLGLVLLGAGQVGTRHFVRLRSGQGPPWLALPIPENVLARHLASASRIQGWWLIAPATSFLVAAAGVVPLPWLPVLALAFVVALDLAGRAACAAALAVAAARAKRRDLPAVTRVLAGEGRTPNARRRSAVRWDHSHDRDALARNDLRLARRDPAARRRAATAAAAIVLSLIAWHLPIETRGRMLLAFAGCLIASSTVAEWLITTIGADPPDVVRALPLRIGAAWGTRMRWGSLAAAVLVAGHLVVATGIGPGARLFFALCIGLASLAITTLGVNYGISLYPRTDQAQRVFALSLGLAMAGSLMMPLMGWIVLVTALIHSARRVARWSRAEVR